MMMMMNPDDDDDDHDDDEQDHGDHYYCLSLLLLEFGLYSGAPADLTNRSNQIYTLEHQHPEPAEYPPSELKNSQAAQQP